MYTTPRIVPGAAIALRVVVALGTLALSACSRDLFQDSSKTDAKQYGQRTTSSESDIDPSSLHEGNFYASAGSSNQGFGHTLAVNSNLGKSGFIALFIAWRIHLFSLNELIVLL